MEETNDGSNPKLYWWSFAVLLFLVIGVGGLTAFTTERWVLVGGAQLLLIAVWAAVFGKYYPRGWYRRRR